MHQELHTSTSSSETIPGAKRQAVNLTKFLQAANIYRTAWSGRCCAAGTWEVTDLTEVPSRMGEVRAPYMSFSVSLVLRTLEIWWQQLIGSCEIQPMYSVWIEGLHSKVCPWQPVLPEGPHSQKPNRCNQLPYFQNESATNNHLHGTIPKIKLQFPNAACKQQNFQTHPKAKHLFYFSCL